MSLKKILGITSFSEIVGIAQPGETCVMIDAHIDELNSEIEGWQREISSLESYIAEEEDKEEPEVNTVKQHQKQIEQLESEICSAESKIGYLNQDRKMVNEARKVGLANRSYILNLLDNSLKEVNGNTYLVVKELLKSGEGLCSSHFGNLQIHYKDVEKNYRLLIDWAMAWDAAAKTFINHFPSSVIQLNLSESELELLFSIIPAVDSYFKKERELMTAEVNQLLSLFPQSLFQGAAYKTDKGYSKRTLGECEEIKALDLEYLWHNFFCYLESPPVELLLIKD